MVIGLRRLLVSAAFFLPIAALAAPPALLPITDFTRPADLSGPILSPDGKLLAVSLRTTDKDGKNSDQLAVLHLPALNPLSRLDMARRNLPGRIIGVSNTRLLVVVAYESAWLDVPQLTDQLLALNYDRSHKTTLYNLASRGHSIH